MASTGTQTAKTQEAQQQSGSGQAASQQTAPQQQQKAQQSQQGSGQQGSTQQESGGARSRSSDQGQELARRGSFGSMYFPSTAEFFSNPFGVMRRMHEEMDRAFADALRGTGIQGTRGGMWAPAIDVSERQGNLVVHAELPGVKPEDVQVEVENDTLVLSGRRERSEEHDEKGVHRSERMFGSFYRAIPLPEGTDTEKARAQFNNGVLEITIPVPQQQSQTRRIPINESK